MLMASATWNPGDSFGCQHQTSFSKKVLQTKDLIMSLRVGTPLKIALLPSPLSTWNAFNWAVIYPRSVWMFGITLLYAVLFSADLVLRDYILWTETVKECPQHRLNTHLLLSSTDTIHGQPKAWILNSSSFPGCSHTQITKNVSSCGCNWNTADYKGEELQRNCKYEWEQLQKPVQGAENTKPRGIQQQI